MKTGDKNHLNFIHYFTFIILLLFSISYEEDDKSNYFFTMYPSHNNNSSHLIHSFTPYSEHLTIDLSSENSYSIKKESISDYSNNHSSIIFYKEDYLIKTCFSDNKIVEIIPLEQIDKDYKSEDQIKTKFAYSQSSLKISKNVKHCYSNIVTNPDTSEIKDENVIMTYWLEIIYS